MTQELHSQARTTHKIREEIKASTLSQAELARRYNVSRHTIAKWQKRDTVEDRSHRPHQLHCTLTPVQEQIVVELRKTLLLATDDLLVVTREFINPNVSRAGIIRLMKRHNISSLKALTPEELAPKQAARTAKFKSYAPGFLHVDIKYLPRMPDEKHGHHYLYVAIDRATRWVFIKIYARQTQASSLNFLAALRKACPVKIRTILTDNGSQFTDRFTSTKKAPTGRHAFDQACETAGIVHRMIPPRHPQTNGMVERFNGRIAEILEQTRFPSLQALFQTLHDYVQVYNHHIPQRALQHLTPVQALKSWQQAQPDLFLRNVYNQTGLDI